MINRQIIVDKLTVNYAVIGEGKPLIMLHGWGDSLQTFSNLAVHLSRKYEIICVDLPGFGKSQAPHETWGLDEYVAFLQHFLSKIDRDQIYGLAGHSNGGAVAIRGVGSGALNPERLILLASAGIRDTYRGKKRTLRLLAKTGKLLTAPLPKPIRQKLKKRAYQSIGSDLFVAEHMQETFKRIVTDDVQAEAAQITIPTLLVYGEQDEATPPLYGEQFHQLIVHSSLVIFPAAGHFVHHDETLKTAAQIEDFLR